MITVPRTNLQDVVAAKAELASLKAVFSKALRDYIDVDKNNYSASQKAILDCQQSANAYFNFAEDFVGNSDLLGAHGSALWVQGFAEDCAEILGSMPQHFAFLSQAFSRLGNTIPREALFPGTTAYANMQRMVVRYLTAEESRKLRKAFEDSNLPTYGFSNEAGNLRGAKVSDRKPATGRGRALLWVAAIVIVIAAVTLVLARRRLLTFVDELPFDLKSEYVGTSPHHKHVAVVMVHGIFGTKNDTWMNQGSSFSNMLATDPELTANVDVFLFEYFTPKFSTAGSIVDLADQLRGRLDDHRVFEDHEQLIFLSHSMGGLIVRQYLITNRDRIPKVAMLYFYATPTNGSELTEVAHRISGNPQLRGMLPLEGNDLLQSIQSSWLADKGLMAIPSYCAYETLPTFGVNVVSSSSARELCNRPLDPITSNHIDIVKPDNRQDPRYTRFISALRTCVPNASAP